MLQDNPDIEMETIAVATNAIRTWKAGIRMIPAFKIGDDILSGLLLSEEKIREFIEKHQTE